MLRVPTQRLEPGMVLARPVPVPNEQGRMLLARGCTIPVDLGRRLDRYGIQDVWIERAGLEFLQSVIDEEVCERQRELYWAMRRSFDKALTGPALPIDPAKYEASVSNLFDALLRNRNNRIFVEKLDSYDNYLISHSVNVCYLALLLGMKLEQYLMQERQGKAPWAKDMHDLALGCLLHDIGKTKIPQALLSKPSELTSEEREVVKRHTVLGYELVKGRVPAAAAQVVLNHHQRFDGTGYPERIDPQTGKNMPPLCGKQIPIFSRLASVCDVYDAATTARCYSGAKPSVQARWEMRQQFVGAFDPTVEAAFYDVVPAFPLGTCVTLSDGSEAAVIDFQPSHAARPKVLRLKTPDGQPVDRPDLDEIDLAETPELSIVATAGVDVREYLEPVTQPRYSLVGTLI